MKTTRRGALGIFGLAGLLPGQALAKSTKAPACIPDDLCVEWLSAPEGIDTPKPRFFWILQAPGSRDVRQTACRIVVGTSKAAVRKGTGDVWDSGKQTSSELRLRPQADLPLKSQTRYWWSVMMWDGAGKPSRWAAPASFVTGIVSGTDWHAKWIAAESDRPPMPLPLSAISPLPIVEPKPLPVFRRDYALQKQVASAVVCVCGLGHYELTINGKPVTQSVLNPGWTNYRKTVFYNTFDVTALLRRGRNALAVMLGNGFYNLERYAGRFTYVTGSFGQPKLILQLLVTFTDGSQTTLVSDASWQTRPGPVTLSNLGNEDFDGRVLQPDWNFAETAANSWSPALEVSGPGGALKAQNIPPVMPQKVYKPVAVTQPKPGVFVYDFGQNMAGWPRIEVQGPAGAKVTMKQAELLGEDGLVNPYSGGGRPGLDHYYSYTLAGRGRETWHPRFSYYGYRYIQVEGAAPAEFAKQGAAVMRGMESVFLHTGLRPTGRFETSETLFNRIHRLIKMALLSNTFSVLSDCPHREKLGWLEQNYLNADTVFCNQDAITLYEKMAVDMIEAQTPDGMIPGIAPEYMAFVNPDGSNTIWRDSPEWGIAIALCPLAAYEYYGDTGALQAAYPAMKRYAAYLESKMKDGLIGFGMGDWDDYAPGKPGQSKLTSLTLTSTASYFALVEAIARTARILGHDADVQDYVKRAEECKRTFNEKLYNPATGTYDTGSQTSNAMPYVLGLVPEDRRAKILANLIADIRAHNNHMTAGDVGFHYVVLALMNSGREDVLYDMLIRTDKPGYGYQLARGATTLIELWDGDPAASQNHFMLGHIETWFYRGLGGINLDMGREGADRIRIAPQFVGALGGVSVRYRSVLGEIVSLWHRKNSRIEFLAGVPAGAQARIVLPARTGILESGVPLASATSVLKVETEADKTTVTVGSGDYRFSLPER